jgi:hypothetical protein
MGSVYHRFESTHPLISASKLAQPHLSVCLYQGQVRIKSVTITAIASGNIIKEEDKAGCPSVFSSIGHDGQLNYCDAMYAVYHKIIIPERQLSIYGTSLYKVDRLQNNAEFFNTRHCGNIHLHPLSSLLCSSNASNTAVVAVLDLRLYHTPCLPAVAGYRLLSYITILA